MKEPGAPGQIPKDKGVPRGAGILPDKGIPPDKGVPADKGVPREQAILPGTPGRKRPGDEGQVPPGTPGQLHKHAENPWAPKEDTVIGDDSDDLIPPSMPLPPASEDAG